MARHTQGLGAQQAHIYTPGVVPAHIYTPGPSVGPRPMLPLTLRACPPGYTTQKIGGQSKCCKTVLENGHMVLKCIERAGIAKNPHAP